MSLSSFNYERKRPPPKRTVAHLICTVGRIWLREGTWLGEKLASAMEDGGHEIALDFGALLRRFRLAAGLSQDALAERARLSPYGISALEHGYRRTPQRETLELLVGALELDGERRRALETAAARAASPRRRDGAAVTVGPWRSTASGNLPVALTRFFGRDAELEEIAVLLAGHRLVTITGASGVGKTQTALRAATALSDQVGAAVCFVDLARIGDSSLVATAVASALGVQEVPNHPLRDTLIAFLKNKTVLLLLDNCEHVVAEAATIADSLLHGCSNLRILATSREPLKTAGERTYRLPSLDENNAVSLFADRAQAADARFDLAGASRPIVSEICRRLSSIPLAIELAAARVTVLPVKALAKALDDRLQVLSEGKRTSAPRQQTMRATIDWSYDLLTKAYDPSLLFSMGGPLNQGSFQVALLNYQNGIEPDPSDFVSCSQRAPNGFNWARYCREDIDRAALQGASVYDRADRRRIYRFIQRRLLEDIPYDFLWQSSEIDVIPSALRGYEPSAISPYSSVAHWRLQE